ncbi:MAG TPA: ergothioneine biosynthesis protein EgtB [Nevskiaceae bacterium]|nr:ergothioneine biosynthesis protein EgtB [Nevskiaceae bacterium]
MPRDPKPGADLRAARAWDDARPAPTSLAALYETTRTRTQALAETLSDADATVQSMPDASPAKWHLAHTTWFFETMVLVSSMPGYQVFDTRFHPLFNSYYEALGARHPRPRRGMLTRPSLDVVRAYRRHVDRAMERVLLHDDLAQDVAALVELGCHHEQQHQELILTDLLHLFAQNPLQPAYRAPEPLVVATATPDPSRDGSFAGGVVEIGHDGRGFAFDCEGPRHQVMLEAFALADRCVTNADWMAFIEDGGYREPLLWLSDGWARVNEQGWDAPLYWERRDDQWWTMTLRGPQLVDPLAPVCHVSAFEADAFARWAGRRLPTEFEWEHAASGVPVDGHFADSLRLRPRPAPPADGTLRQLFGDVWEWTSSAFLPYPRFSPASGAVGEYNGKFMSGQTVLRGGSCITPPGHVRATYRNFFPPDARWQFSGLRLAKDG